MTVDFPTLLACGLRSLLWLLGDSLSCTVDGDASGEEDIPMWRGLQLPLPLSPLPKLWCCGLSRGGVKFWAAGGII